MSQMGRTVCVADPSPCYADSMALFAPPGKKPVFADAKRPCLALAHLTSVPLSRRSFSGALSAHRAFVRQTLSNSGVRWVRTEKDLISLPAGDLGVLFGMQHAPEGMTEENVRQLHDEGLQSMGLFEINSSKYGNGFGSHTGLMEHDRRLIEWMAENNILLDLSCMNHRAAYDALDFIRKESLPGPMVSHSGCYSVFQHPMNLQDGILKAIGEMQGYVGIAIIPILPIQLERESDEPYIKTFIRHIAHASRVCGADNVGIGSGAVHADPMFVTLKENLSRKFSTPAVKGFLGRNFEYFLLRSLPS